MFMFFQIENTNFLKIGQVVFEKRFGTTQDGDLHSLNIFIFLLYMHFVEVERWLKCQFYHFGGCRIHKLHYFCPKVVI